MISWQPPCVDGSQAGSVQLSDGSYATAILQYGAGCYDWYVRWNGYSFKSGSGCVDRKEARRAADEWLEKILNDECEPPWKPSNDRVALEARLLAARLRDATFRILDTPGKLTFSLPKVFGIAQSDPRDDYVTIYIGPSKP